MNVPDIILSLDSYIRIRIIITENYRRRSDYAEQDDLC